MSLNVLIAGGGVAALEAALALRERGARIELVSPASNGSLGRALARLRESGVRLSTGTVTAVAPGCVTLADGTTRSYERLLLAVGATRHAAVPGAETLWMPGARPVGRVPLPARLAIVLPAAACWELPAYELALDCARRVGAVTLVTPEARPLDVFGEEASEAVAGWLDGAGVEVRTESTAVGVVDGALVLADGDRVPADCVLAAPALEGPRIAGLPLDEAGFVVVDAACAVPGVEGVFAAGDATAGTTKLGSLAAHQADTAAAAIAGAPFDLPQVLRGLLLTGGEPLYLRRDAAGSRASHQALWWPPVRFPGTYLASFLISAGLSTARLTDRDPVEAT